MPKIAIDYSKTIIYKIVCRDVNVKDLYVGSTTDFTVRKNAHKYACINPDSKCHHMYVYQFIRKSGGWDNWQMIEIVKMPNCKDAQEKFKRERHFIEEMKATLNKNIPTRTQTEYYEANKDEIKARHKQYNEANKDKIKLYKNKYNEANKGKIKTRNNQLYICECGCQCSQHSKQRHLRSKKHQAYLQKQNDNK